MQMTIIERYERNEILRALEEHLLNYWSSILLRDHKEFVEELFSDMPSGSFDRMMYFFTSDYNNVDLENRPVAKALYEKLGWNLGYHDVINSFYTTFVCSLVAYSESEEAPSFRKIYDNLNNDNTLKKTIESWKCSLFGFGHTTNLKVAMCGELIDIGKKAYANKVLEKGNLQHIILEQYFFVSSNNKALSEKVLELTPLCHSAANFMPCPYPPFNQAKGTAKAKFYLDGTEYSVNLSNDYLPLMIELIDKVHFDKEEKESQALIDFSWKGEKEDKYNKIEKAEVFYSYSWYEEKSKKWNSEDRPITRTMINNWEIWFINEENRKNYFLEDYYFIDDDNGNKKLQGKPLFKNQSLSYPIPKTKGEVEECIINIITITKRRADSMAKKILSRMQDKETCEDIWV